MNMSVKKQVPQKRWIVIYTRSRNEKKVAEELVFRGFEAYLPLIKTLRQWSDRKRLVEVPLFNSYVFVHVEADLIPKVMETTGAVYVVKFGGTPAVIPAQQIENLKLLLDTTTNFEISYDEFTFDEHVEVIRGPLQGFRGVFVEYKGRKQVLMRLEAINQSLLITIQPGMLRKITSDNMATHC